MSKSAPSPSRSPRVVKPGLHSATAAGLSAEEAARRLAAIGPNAVAEVPAHPIRRIILRFLEPVPLMLEAAIGLQLAIGERIEAIMIAALLLFNVALSIYQEGRADAALAALKTRLALRASVKRDGRWSDLPAEDLVPGDVVRLSLGAVVPADVRITEGGGLVDQSMLTGESVPAEFGPGEIAYAGGVVRRGGATGEVSATGSRTYSGRGVELVRVAHAESGEQRAVLGIVRNLAIFNGAIIVGLVAYALMSGMAMIDVVPLVLTGILASIPAALPATFSLAAALGAQRLVRKGVLLTRLTAVHEAATMDVLCVDKTGTLTRNELAIASVWCTQKAIDDGEVLGLAALASSESGQDPVDLAVRAAAAATPASAALPTLRTFTPFDPATKTAEALLTDAAGRDMRVVKGAPSAVAKIAPLPPEAAAELERLSTQGYRVLAVAIGPPAAMALVGLIALSDPPRPDARELLSRLKSMGIRVVMVTGDAVTTAVTVARAIGLEGPACPPGKIDDRIDPNDFAIFAGVFPEDKYRLVKAFQRNGRTVGMCGDGANDAPALRQAQMGIAVSTATDVAKSAAGLVLVEPGLSGIVAAVDEGRATFQRIMTYTLNTLIKKFELVLFLGVGLLVAHQAALTPMLMALLLVTGDVVTMALATDKARPSPKTSSWRVQRITEVAMILGLVKLAFSLAVVAVGKYGLALAVDELQTLAFVTLVFGGQAAVYVVRERGRLWKSRPSIVLMLSSVADIGIALWLATSGALMAPLPPTTIGVVLIGSLGFALVLDTAKIMLARTNESQM